eukprot:6717905-Prymnesium_polylepis.3
MGRNCPLKYCVPRRAEVCTTHECGQQCSLQSLFGGDLVRAATTRASGRRSGRGGRCGRSRHARRWAVQWARRRRRRRAPRGGRWRRRYGLLQQAGRVSWRGAKQGDTAGDGRRREMCPRILLGGEVTAAALERVAECSPVAEPRGEWAPTSVLAADLHAPLFVSHPPTKGYVPACPDAAPCLPACPVLTTQFCVQPDTATWTKRTGS